MQTRSDTLKNYCQKNNVELCDEYIKIEKKTQISFKCVDCNVKHNKSYDAFIYGTGPYCKTCLRNKKNNDYKYNKSNLLNLLNLLKIVHNNEYNGCIVNRNTRVTGNCKTPDCINKFDTSYRELHEKQNEGYCKICTNNTKAIKVSKTKREQRKLLKYEESFASHPKSKYFANTDTNKNENGELVKTTEIPRGTHDIHDFNCDCGHTFPCRIAKVVFGRWCPYCCEPPKKLCGDKDCKRCFNKSCASNAFMVSHWNIYKNKLPDRYKDDVKINNICKENPANIINYILKRGDTIIWLNCGVCKKPFKSCAKSVDKGCGCGFCKNKTEKKIEKMLKLHNVNAHHEFKPPEFVSDELKRKRFDFYIEQNKIIIELDGEQHFIQVKLFKKPLAEVQELDRLKMQEANKHGYSFIRIYQPDVHFNRYEWDSKIIQSIEKIIKDGIVQNIFISSGKEYECFPQTNFQHSYLICS